MTNRLFKLRTTLNLAPKDMALLMGIGDVANYSKIEIGRSRKPTLKDHRAMDIIEFVAARGYLEVLLETLRRG